MFIKKLILHNFQLFIDQEITFDKINVVSGINEDDSESSSNGSGKSTLVKHAITFVLYGDVSGIKLQDLIHIGKKEARVELVIQKGKDVFRIIRKIPSGLIIFLNDNEVKFNTATLSQIFINEQFCDYSFFKKYRMIDSSGINLLDLGIISLRKELMSFVDDLFTSIRKSLLNKKLERETYNVNKRLYRFHLSEKRLQLLEENSKKRLENLHLAEESYNEQSKVNNELSSEISSREKIIKYKEQDNKKLNNGICPVLNNKCSVLNEHSLKVNINQTKEIVKIQSEIKVLNSDLEIENSVLNYNQLIVEQQKLKLRKTEQYLLKLKEAFKFKNYKYTAQDVLLYSEAIKTIDSFAAYYVSEWLSQLALIINDILKVVNLQVEFSVDKDFIKIQNENAELKYEMLSSGQKVFLSAIFKLAILMQRGDYNGIIIADEGLSTLDNINLKKFIEIAKTLNYQFFVVYQNVPEIEDVHKIEVIRKEGVSNVSFN